MHHLSLSEWTKRIKSLHVTEMDLSLERVKVIALRLGLLKPSCPVMTIGGTNGKGSTVAGLEAIYRAQGYRVGAFTTPFLFKPNEQIRVDGQDVSDELFCGAYQAIDDVRNEITLTPFEFNALAALIIFAQSNLDVVILEVGLGGRWDAVNIIDTDLAVITSIGIDHIEWLGNTREAIAQEKAGIFRSSIPVVCGDFDPPLPLSEIANQLHAPFYYQGKDFGFEKLENALTWQWWSENNSYNSLPLPKLALQNMATVLKAIELMQERLPVAEQSIREGLSRVNLIGRIQKIAGKVPHIFDVSHNPASAEFLAKWLKENPIRGKTHAVFSMLKDKDIFNTLLVIKEVIDDWYIAPIHEIRGASIELLQECFSKVGIKALKYFPSLDSAYKLVLASTNKDDRIVIFGSFRTVAQLAKSTTLGINHDAN